MSLRNRPIPVASEDYLPLLGDFHLWLPRFGWTGKDGAAHRPPSTPNRATSAVKHDQLYTRRCRHPSEHLLGLVGLPGGRQVPAILIAVGVTHHNLLAVVPSAQRGPVRAAAKQLRQHISTGAQFF